MIIFSGYNTVYQKYCDKDNDNVICCAVHEVVLCR